MLKERQSQSRETRVRYYDDDFEEREGIEIERNGNLTLIENEKGEPLWLAPFEIATKENYR